MNSNIEKTQEIRKSKEIAIKVPNKLLNKQEQELLNFGLYKMAQDHWDFKKNILKKSNSYKTSFTITEIEKQFGKSFKNYALVRDFIKGIGLYGYTMNYKTENGKDGIKVFSVFKEVDFNDNGIYMEFNNKFLNHLLEVKKDFIKLELNEIKNFKSKYTYRLYEYLKARSIQNSTNIKLSIGKFREITGTEKQYKRFQNLHARVIKPIEQDLQNSDLLLRIKLKKEGKTYSHIYFKGNNQSNIFKTSDWDIGL